MCRYFIVHRLLMLKILLATFTGLVMTTQYDYGYHPSAEEFDNLLRETRRTWTYNFLKTDRDHLLNKPISAYNTNNLQNRKPLKTEARYFVPKFQYENEVKKFHSVSFNPHADQQLAGSNKQPQVPLKNVGSTLDFNYYSDELPQPIFNTATSTYKPPEYYNGISPTLPEINLKPINKPHIVNSKNSSQDHFPIYFTNPATGIVYAITEVGKTEGNLTATNGSIPIFITKEQYERDIKHLKQAYEQKCPQIYTTPRPQIIRILKKPSTSVLPINSTKLAPPQSLKKPPPVVVKTELIVKDKPAATSTLRPLRKKKKKTKAKPKLKKRNPPGHKRTTVRPILANQLNGPVIIMGTRSSTTRKPLLNVEKLSTQLEKPNFDIFSSATAPHGQQHKVKKRSPAGSYKTFNILKGLKNNSSEIVRGISSNKVDKESVLKILNRNSSKEINPESLIESVLKTLKSRRDSINLIPNSPTNLPSSTLMEHNVHKRSLNNSEPKFIKKSNTTSHQLDLKNSSSANTNSERSFNASTEKNRKSENKGAQKVLKNSKLNSKLPTPVNGLRKRKRNSKIKSNSETKNSNFSQMYSLPKGLTTTPRTIKKANKTRKKHKNMAKKSNREKADEEYYFFTDYDDNEEEDEDEDYNDDDDDDEDDVDDDDEDKDQEIVNHNDILAYEDDDNDTPTLPTSELSISLEELTEKPIIQNIKNAYEEEDNDSSTLQIEQIKFKAPAPAVLDYDMINRLKLKSQSSPSGLYKKRIRRRPQLKIDRDDYDYDDEEDSNGIGSNLGGFFRMIFYPIQVVMSSVMDSLAGGKDAEDEEDNSLISNPYTQYTSYHNTLKQQSSDDYDEDYDSNESSVSSLSSWFSSWFGLNRRNKKISSTTVAPVQPKPTKSSTSWLYSWLGFANNDRISTESQSTETDDEYDKWFTSWFGDTKPKARKRTTTTTTTTTQLPHVPILTIVDPMKNPQNWIGILAHHIINHTATSTVNPLKDMWSKMTTTTTENPEIPRKINYEKYQIWRLKPQDDSQVKALEEYKKSEDGIKLQWLKGPSLRGLTDVLVPPKMLVDFQASLTFELIDHEVLIFDVGKAIAYEKTKEDYFFTTTQKPKKHQNKIPPHAVTAGITWRRYYEYDDIIKYLETMRMRFPHLVELIHIGRSYEGRPLIVMKIESKEAAAVNSAHYPAHQRNKLRHRKRIGLANAVFIEAGTHGMEWIGPATATWIINELLRIMKKNVSDDQSFIRNTTWYIMPVLNPDGYVYSHEYDRFWKKSRSRHISRPLGILNSAMTWLQKKRAKEKVCFGVDLDRNWHYQWGKRGSSKSVCNEFYAGPTPFSEPETKALSEFLMDYRTQIKLFISMQAYGQIISYPYKANTTYDSERLDDLLDVAMVGTDGLRKKGSKSRYKIDSSNDLIENRSGCSDAFAAYEAGIPFSYTLQLADNGVHGYLLPSASIESTAKDAFEIITTMLDYI